MNAKEELIEFLKENEVEIIAAKIKIEESIFELPVDHTQQDYESFLKYMDFNYDSGYGGQNLFGYLWLRNNEWASRGEYDGSEWWNLNRKPEYDKINVYKLDYDF